MAAFLCEDHNVLYSGDGYCINMTYICAFLSFRYERRETVNSPLWLGNDS